MIDFGCPRCGTAQRVADSAAGKKVPCPKCGQRLLVPQPPDLRTLLSVPTPNLAGADADAGPHPGPVTRAVLQRVADASGDGLPVSGTMLIGRDGHRAQVHLPHIQVSHSMPRSPCKAIGLASRTSTAPTAPSSTAGN